MSDDYVEQIAKAIALADMAAKAPKGNNPSTPLTKVKRYYRVLTKVKAGKISSMGDKNNFW